MKPIYHVKRPSEQVDDFTRIHGIGPAIEKSLHAGGVLTYAQLAALTPEEVFRLVGEMIGMTVGRISEQDWIGQAKKLAVEMEAGDESGGLAVPRDGWHYAVFTVELLLDEANRVRRTRALHVQSRADHSWPGWDAQRLEAFIVENAEIAPGKIEGNLAEEDEEARDENRVPGEVEPAPTKPSLGGVLYLAGLELEEQDVTIPFKLLHDRHPLRATLSLDLREVECESDLALAYSSLIYARRFGAGSRELVAQAEGWVQPAEQVNLVVEDLHLAPGVYRLEALVELKPDPGGHPQGVNLLAFIESGIIRVN